MSLGNVKRLGLIMLATALLGIYTAALNPVTTGATGSGKSYYVSRNGDNTNGLSWQTAWNELDQIDWELISAGDVIYLDGGVNQMVYESELHIGQSGQQGKPITIQASKEAGHHGQVILFGGRNQLLPYCGQRDYQQTASEYREYGIRTRDHDYIVIDGASWRGIAIHGYQTSGIRIDRNSQHVTVRYVEVYNNGEAKQYDNGWRPDHAGVRIGGSHNTLQRVIIHDNGHDAIQSLSGENNLHNFRLQQSWLYNGRQHPTVNESANYCTHTDGIQIFDGGIVAGLTVTESIIGPGFTQNLILGQTRNDNGSWADVHDVVLRDVLLTKAADNNLISYRDTDPSNWTIEQVTIHCPNTKSHCVRLENANHSIVGSIVVDGLVTMPDGINTLSNNCQWNARGFSLGQAVDPQFANVSNSDFFSRDNYSVPSSSPCQGSRITSVNQLLNLR